MDKSIVSPFFLTHGVDLMFLYFKCIIDISVIY